MTLIVNPYPWALGQSVLVVDRNHRTWAPHPAMVTKIARKYLTVTSQKWDHHTWQFDMETRAYRCEHGNHNLYTPEEYENLQMFEQVMGLINRHDFRDKIKALGTPDLEHLHQTLHTLLGTPDLEHLWQKTNRS